MNKKINIVEYLPANKKQEFIEKSNYVQISNFQELKEVVENLANAKKLDFFRFNDFYTNILGNEWLLNTPISKYGVFNVKEDIPNSLSALNNAIKQKFAILIPVQILADGNLICFKDKTLGHYADENGYISNFTYDELKEVHLNKTDNHIMLLEDVLNTIKGKVPVVIEILNESSANRVEETVLKNLLTYIDNHPTSFNKIAILSANPYSLEWFYKNAPYFTRIIKSGTFQGLKEYAGIKTKKLKKLKLTSKVAHADFIAYDCDAIPNPYIKKYKSYGVLAYNVSSQEEYESILGYGLADNIIFSDFIPKI